MNEPVRADRRPTDDEVRAEVRVHVGQISGHVKEIVRLLGEHSPDVDYHGYLLKQAIVEIGYFARTVEQLEQPVPAPYRPEAEQGPPKFEYGKRRFKVMVRLTRPAVYDGPGPYGEHICQEYTEAEIKKVERSRFYDYGTAATVYARAYAYEIGKWVASVQILDRLTKTLWTYDAEGDCTELTE